MSKKWLAVLIIGVILIADQVLKIWIKTHLMIGDEIVLFKNWGFLHFVENNGMAFGLEWGGKAGKVVLTLFRLLAASAIFYVLFKKMAPKAETPKGLVAAVALIFSGAVGNIIDSAFYGMIFNESFGQIATLFPEGGGYSSFLHGRVVDMFYFPMIRTTWPDWSPINAGESFIFFRPIFNLADSAITVGITIILLFYRDIFNEKKEDKVDVAENNTTTE